MKIYNNKKGLSVGVVIIMMIVIGLIVDSVSKLTLQTNRTQQDYMMWMEAKNAAESAVEYGFAQLMSRFQLNSSFPTDALAPNRTPLSLPSRFFTTFGNKTGPWKTVTITLPTQATYDATNIAQWSSRPTDLLGGVTPPGVWTFINGNQPGNEYDPQKNMLVFVRNINVYGKATASDWRNLRSTTVYAKQTLQVRDAPLFANAIFYNMDLEIAPGASMTVTGPVHTNYNAYVSSSAGLSFTGQFTSAGSIYHNVMGGFGKTLENGAVSFLNTSGTQTSMYQNSQWIDSNLTNFRQLASQYWGGNLQSSAFGIPQMNPVGMPSYVRDNPATTGTPDDALNYAYQLIQPTVSTTASNYSAEIEKQKFAYKAGLTITVNTSGPTPTFTLSTLVRDGAGNVLYDVAGNPRTTSLTYTGSNNFVNAERYTTTGSGSTVTVTGGMYDARRAQGLGTVEIDMGRLTTAIGNGSGAQQSDWNNTPNTPSNWWNGIVYVQFSDAAPRTTDGVEVPVGGWGVKLINGSNIPNPAFAQAQGIYGTTVATNNPVYVQGHYNSDGNSATGTGGNADNVNQPPAAIAGDAITVLSTAWNDAMSARALSSRVASSFTEVSAAFLTGLVPSDNANNNAYSGGVENFPRFLENWSSRTFRYKGSMVSLFESEVATQPWPGTGSVYNAPTRDWSFDRMFAQGKYPPGTPNSRTFRRISYNELTKAQWDAEMVTLRSQMGF